MRDLLTIFSFKSGTGLSLQLLYMAPFVKQCVRNSRRAFVFHQRSCSWTLRTCSWTLRISLLYEIVSLLPPAVYKSCIKEVWTFDAIALWPCTHIFQMLASGLCCPCGSIWTTMFAGFLLSAFMCMSSNSNIIVFYSDSCILRMCRAHLWSPLLVKQAFSACVFF